VAGHVEQYFGRDGQGSEETMKNDLFELIKKMNRMIKRVPAAANQDNASRGQGRMLHIIMKNEGIKSKELAALMDLRPSSLTEKLDKLETDGNIRRVRDQHDTRVVRLYITEKGKDAVSRSLREKENKNNGFSAYFSQEEKEQFRVLGEKFCTGIEKMIKETRGVNNRAPMIETEERPQINKLCGG